MAILSFSDTTDNGHLFVAAADQFQEMRWAIASRLLKTEPENHGKWQQLDVSQSGAHRMHELLNVTAWYDMPMDVLDAQECIKPDLPWAENHFWERVGGKAVNPGVEYANWPYHANGLDLHMKGKKYDHNYMERFWPTDLQDIRDDLLPFHGYRFAVGDLDDVVRQLEDNPGTRQAYLPIFFPEDTGATAGQRVPCTLGYHFIIRDGLLHVQYNMRSCEIYRHFTNDVYMAVRLAHWVIGQLPFKLDPGQLTMNIVSLHALAGDANSIRKFQNP